MLIVGLAVLCAPALADEEAPDSRTSSEMADEWVRNNGGAEGTGPSSYWPDTWALDQAFGRDQTPTMQAILSQIAAGYDALPTGTNRSDECPNAAREKLVLYSQNSAHFFASPQFHKFGLKAIRDLLSLPKAATSRALDAAQRAVRDQFMDHLKDRAKKLPESAFKKIEQLLGDPSAPEVFSRNGSWTSSAASGCDIVMRVIWDKTLRSSGSGNSRQFYHQYSYIIIAQCECECDPATGVERSRPVKVKSLVSGGVGRIVINVTGTTISFQPARPRPWAQFNCCGSTRPYTFGRPPSEALGSNQDETGTTTQEPPPPPPDDVQRAADEAATVDPKSPEARAQVDGFRSRIAEAQSVEDLMEIYDEMDGARHGYREQADNLPPGPSKDAARAAEQAIDELLENELQQKYDELENQGSGADFSPPNQDDWLAALNSELLYCPQDAWWSHPPEEAVVEETFIENRPIYFQTVVREPEVCVGTTFTVITTEGIEQYTTTIRETIEVAEVPDAPPPEEPEVPEEPVSAPPPDEPVISPPPQDPASPPPPEEPVSAPPPEEPVSALPPEDEGGPPPEEPDTIDVPDEEIDLGLVKANETVVEIALGGEQPGSAFEGTLVKLTPTPPPLPVAAQPDGEDGAADQAYRSTEAYRSDVAAGLADADGIVVVAAEFGRGPQVASQHAGETQISLVDEEDLVEEVEDDLVEESAPAGVNNQVPTEEAQPAAMIERAANGMPKSISAELAMSDQRSTVPLVVAANPAADPSQMQFLLEQAGIATAPHRTFMIGETPVYVISVQRETLQETAAFLATNTAVTFVEEDPCRQKEVTDDPHFPGSGLWGQAFDNQWAIKRVGFTGEKDDAWSAAGEDLQPVTVAVIDTGIDWFHPDLPAASLWRNPGEIAGNGRDDDGNGYVDDVIGWNMIEDTNEPWDQDGHGTFVAGLIAAGRSNGIGIAGINPAAKIMPLKALDAFGQGHASMIAEAIAYAADNGARVINLSLGGRGLTKLEQLAVDHARGRGAVLVVAAGNSAKAAKDYAPAGLEGVLTVAATDRRDRRAGFSNWGPAVDLAAPGVDVLSLRARDTDLLAYIPGVRYRRGEGILGEDRAYYRASGTSFAAPIVSGVMSLILSRDPERTSQQATRMVLNSARDLEMAGIDNYTGYGLVDAPAAVQADPDYFVDSRITGVDVVQVGDTQALRLFGTADADAFAEGIVYLGEGAEPERWLKVKTPIAQPVRGGTLMALPTRIFSTAKTWTVRLVVSHANGSTRQATFVLTLG